MVESRLFPHHLNEFTFNQRGIDVELTSLPSGTFQTELRMLTFTLTEQDKFDVQIKCCPNGTITPCLVPEKTLSIHMLLILC